MRAREPKRKTEKLFPQRSLKFTLKDYRNLDTAYRKFMEKRGLYENFTQSDIKLFPKRRRKRCIRKKI